MSVVGVDLGTTNTVVGCVRGGKVHVLADDRGRRLLPSVVSFHPNGEVLVGDMAKARRIIDAPNTIYSHKRLIGRSWGSAEIAQARQRFPFELREGPGQGPLVHARGQDYTLPEISAFVLKRARQIAERALGSTIERAVITVPAHFNELQRASTKVAGRVAGIEVLRILNEPTAAALAYGLGRSGNERVAVYDFGGGTFDCTLLDLNGNVFEVLATAGDSFLGGDDVDSAIAERMADTFLKLQRQDARQDIQMFERLKAAAEEVKIALSSAESHTVILQNFGHGAKGRPLDFPFTLTRGELDAMITPLIDRTFKVTQDALALARMSPTAFDKVILVGGSTRIPVVRKRVEAFFGAPPMDRVNPDEVVAIGAAIQAAALTEGLRRRSIPPPPTAPPRQPDASQADDPTLNEASARPTLSGDTLAAAPRAALPSEPTVVGAKTAPMRMRQPTIAGVAPPTASAIKKVPTAPLAPPAGASTAPLAPPARPLGTSTAPLAPPATPPSFGGTMPLAPPTRPSAPPAPATMNIATVPTPFDVQVPVEARRPSQPPALPRSAYTSEPPALTSKLAPPMPRPPSAPPSAPPTYPAPPPNVAPYQASPPPPYAAPHHPSSAPPYAAPPYAASPPVAISAAPAYGSLPPGGFSLPSAPPLQPVSRPPILVDVTPRALIVETAGGYTDTVITRNAKIPCERTRRFATSRDMQTTVRVRVAQGEEHAFARNTYLGEVELTGLRAAPRGTVSLAVTFEVDVNGTLRVRARDEQTGHEAHATLQLVGVANESSVAMMIDRVAHMPVTSGPRQS